MLHCSACSDDRYVSITLHWKCYKKAIEDFEWAPSLSCNNELGMSVNWMNKLQMDPVCVLLYMYCTSEWRPTALRLQRPTSHFKYVATPSNRPIALPTSHELRLVLHINKSMWV